MDSSHAVRPQGDVTFEFLELLPRLRRGVVVHVHDVFTPRDIRKGWLESDVKFWYAQYILEAFLSHNAGWEIIGAVNVLKHCHYETLRQKCPFVTEHTDPGSLYLRRLQ